MLSTPQFRNNITTNGWNNCPAPSLNMKKNCALLDSQVQLKRNEQKLSSEAQVYSMLLLKQASVLGEVFSLRQLKEVFTGVEQTKFTIEALLRDLEKRNLVEFLCGEGEAAGGYYRFTSCFLTETLYQLMLFWQKRDVHEKMIEYLKNYSIFDWTTDVRPCILTLTFSGVMRKRLGSCFPTCWPLRRYPVKSISQLNQSKRS